jgi:hypothetical protein
VAQATAAWSADLAGLVTEDPLTYYRDLPDATLDLTHAHPSGLAMLLAGRPCRLSALVREPGALADARRRARAVQASTTALADERGLDAGWLAVGLATWQVPDDEPVPTAPVLLRSCRLRPRGAAGDDVDIDLGSKVLLNPQLVSAMAGLDVHLDGDVIADLALREDGFDPRPLLERVAQTCRHVPGFGIDHRYLVSAFVTSWSPLLSELADAETLGGHEVVAALAADPHAVEAVAADPGAPALEDAAREVEAHLVLDADTAQQSAITRVVAGSHLVIDAPSGTGASQTIANLVAVLAAAGRRVLVLSPRRSSLEAVLTRLDDVGLRELALDLPDGGIDRRRAVRLLTRTLDRAGAVPEAEPSDLARRRDGLRQLLDDHVAALHESREPWGSSAYDAQLALAELTSRRPAPRSRVRVRSEQLTRLDRDELDRIRDELREVAELGVFRAGPDDDPWFGARLTTPDEATEALDRATRAVRVGLPSARERMGALLSEAGMPAARSVQDWERALRLLAEVRSTLEVFSAKVYDTSLADVVAATGSAAWRREHGVRMSTLQRRRLRRHCRSLLRPGRPPADLHGALVRAADQRRRWQELAGRGSVPRLPSGLALAERAYSPVREDLDWLAQRLTATPAGGGLLTDDLQALAARLDLLATRATSLPLVPRVVALRDALSAVGLEALLDDLAQRDVPAQDVGAELDLVWWTSLLQHVAQTDARYGRHDGDALRRTAAEFAEADRAYLAYAAQQVRRLSAGRLVRTLDRCPEQATLVRSESSRERRWRPLAELVHLAPDVVAAARPCWTMSPLVVPQALPPGAWFDVVVVDDASEAGTAETVPALSRGRQVVVVGDLQQARSGSVLSRLSELLPVTRLRTLHGVLDPRVTTFANEHAYGGTLVALPSPVNGDALTFHPVDGTGMLVPGQDAVETTDAEVQRVVELVVAHARTRPHESLGVITLTPAHAARVETALRVQLTHVPEAAAFVNADGPERFFVKVVDRVHGDTRDAIILSVGYGRTAHGRVLHRFGPVSRDGGDRLLVAATTRSRRRLAVVAAFAADDLDPDRLTSPGSRLLRDLLQHVAAGGAALGPAVPEAAGTATRRPDPLVIDLATRLRSDDLEVRVGQADADESVDLAVSEGSGGGWLAVETDGPRYARHSARVRDRLRPEALARRGWHHERVWSTDLFRDPAREVARVRAAARVPRPADGPDAVGTSPAGPGVRWDSGHPESPWTAVSAQRRGERPRVPTGRAIEDYRDDELDAVVRWICSDTLLRTHEQLSALVRQQLGLVRRSTAVDAAVSAAITRVVARGEVRTRPAVERSAAPSQGRRTSDGAQPAARVQAHDPHERWLLDQRPPHWD